jgi:hypothetical protein
MKKSIDTINPELLEFWQTHGQPGRIGLIHLDYPPAKVINWAERFATPDGKPSPWVHCFLFLRKDDGYFRIAESDVYVPLLGIRPKPDGPQENSIRKWSHPLVDHVMVLDSGVTEEQFLRMEHAAQDLHEAGYTYGISSLVQSGIALVRQDMNYRGPLYQPTSMHCGHFLRHCLQLGHVDPFAASILPEHTVPALFPQVLPIVAEWERELKPK